MKYLKLLLAFNLFLNPISINSEETVVNVENSEEVVVDIEESEEDIIDVEKSEETTIDVEKSEETTVDIENSEEAIVEVENSEKAVVGVEKLESFPIEAYIPEWNGKTYNLTKNKINLTIEDEVLLEDDLIKIPVLYFNDIYKDYGYSFENDVLTYYDSNSNKYLNAQQKDGYIIIPFSDKGMFYYNPSNIKTDIISPSSTVIHMFDYWSSYNRYDSDNHSTSQKEANLGINANHQLKFGRELTTYGLLNKSYGGTSTPSKVTQGIVKNVLGEDGYPCLSGDESLGMSYEESLNYLFNPKQENEGKVSFENTKNLLTTTSDGYFYYNSLENYAYLNEDNHIFTIYNTPGGKNTSIRGYSYGQFFPYNEFNTINLLSNSTDPINHYLGMSMLTRFYQNYDGYTNSNKNQEMVFEFSGDNDVWVFIDSVLVADMGGLSSARQLSMNFRTGQISITDGDTNPTTTIRQAFVDAGMENINQWNGDTFANETSHVLKFFYLERGGYDSNLKLKFNLSEIPPTNILKISQYGDPIQGAEFSCYKADDDYNIISDVVYSGVTDVNGEMTFVDEEGLPLPLNEIENLLGNKFVIRETHVPDGYRTVKDDIGMYIEGGMIQVRDTYQSGIWSNPNAMINPSNVLYIAKDYYPIANSIPDVNEDYTIDYIDINDNSTRGTLFSVILKRNNENPDAVELTDFTFNTWTPVYGNDIDGYFELDDTTVPQVDRVISAAKNQNQNYNNVCFHNSSSGVQLMLEDIPDYPEYYYSYVLNNSKSPSQVEYLIAYYWTSADSLDGANSSNTVRIKSHENTTPEFDTGFLVKWGATIKIPNIENRLYVQKTNEQGDVLGGAAFALYNVTEENNTMLYYSEAGNKISLNDVQYRTLDDGVILLDNDERIVPVDVQTVQEGEEETFFSKLNNGWYVLKEIKSPFGYDLNYENIKVIVDDNGVYANAGQEGNGILVGNGLGYLSKTLTPFASEGSINETLSWIAIILKIRLTDTFESFKNTNDWIYYVKHNPDMIPGTGDKITDNFEESMISYLCYDPSHSNSIFDYYPNEDQSARTLTLDDGTELSFQEGERVVRLFTDQGWSSLATYQDYAYGYKKSQERYNTEYEDLRMIDISNLFSCSTIVRVADKKAPDSEQFVLPNTGGIGKEKVISIGILFFIIGFIIYFRRKDE